MNIINSGRLTLIIILCVAAGVAARTFPNSGSTSAASAPQDVTNLERRISLLEQRFYSVESSINRREQQAALSGRAAPSTSMRDPEISLLRGEVETLQRRFI